MKNYRYLIVGGGMTAAAAVEGILEVDAAGSIGMICAEADRPYNRPPLSKALWKGGAVSEIWCDAGSDRVEYHPLRRVTEIRPDEKFVRCDTGDEFAYDTLLLATGGAARRLPFADDDIIPYRTLADYRRLRDATEKHQRFAVIGGGFIGSEIAAALSINGKEVTMIFPGTGIGERVFPAELSRHVSRYYERKGVSLLAGRNVLDARKRGDLHVLSLSDGATLEVDCVVAGIGIQPETGLAEAAGLEVDNGIVVDEYLRSSRADIFAAGDVARFFNPALGKRMRVEHEDNANTMGRTAGRNMAGAAEPYTHLPSFYSDLFDLGYEAVGELDATLETVVDWKVPFEEGVVYYMESGRVRGVLLWNVWEQVDAARALITEAGPFSRQDLKGRLPAMG